MGVFEANHPLNCARGGRRDESPIKPYQLKQS